MAPKNHGHPDDPAPRVAAPPLKTVVELRAKELGISLRELAETCRVPYNTLLSWLDRNAASGEFVRVARFLKLEGKSIEELARRYSFSAARQRSGRNSPQPRSIGDLGEAMDQIDIRLRRAIRQLNLRDIIEFLLRSMQEDDLFVMSVFEDNLLESQNREGADLVDALGQAASQGAHIAYFLPSALAIHERTGLPQNLSTNTAERIEMQHENLKKRMPGKRTEIDSHVHMFRPDEWQYWFHGIVVGGFLTKSLQARAYLRVIGDDGSRSDLLVKAAKDFAALYFQEACRAMKREIAGSDGAGGKGRLQEVALRYLRESPGSATGSQ